MSKHRYLADLVTTGVFATQEEVASLKKQLDTVTETPVISLTGKAKHDWHLNALRELEKTCHDIAMSHGLPDYQGYYGIDLTTGEFVKYE